MKFYVVSDALRRAGINADADWIFGYGVVPGMVVVVTVVRVSGHSTTEPDTSCTGNVVFVFCIMLSVYVHVCLLCLCYDVTQSLPAFRVLLSTVLGAAITVPGRATAFGLDWIGFTICIWLALG